MENLLQQGNLNLPDNKADLKLYGVNTDGTPSDGQFPASDLLEDVVSNIPSITQTIPVTDWTGDLQDFERIWNTINAGANFDVNDNEQVYYRTKQILLNVVGSANTYQVLVKRWRETKKYPANTILGSTGNLQLNFLTSVLELEYEKTYTVEDGGFGDGDIVMLTDVTDIATSVNSLTEVLYPQQNEILFQSNTDQAWIYAGNLEQIGQGVTTLLSEYIELEPNSSTEVESLIDVQPINTSDLINDGEGNGEPFVGADSLVPNIVVRGLQNDVSTLEQFVTTYFQPSFGGGLFNAQEVEDNFSTFRINGDTITLIATGVDFYFRPRFGADGNSGANCTHFYDYSGKLKGLPFQQWTNSTNIQEIFLEGDVSIAVDCLQNCPNLTALVIPKAKSLSNNVRNCPALVSFDFTNLETISNSLNNSTILPTVIDEFDFPKVSKWLGQDLLSNQTSITMPNLKELGGNGFRNGQTLINFYAPKLEIIGAGCFRNCGNLVSLDLPLCEEIGSTGGATTFWDNTSLTLLNIHKCKVLGADVSTSNDFWNTGLGGLTINANEFLKTANSGNIHGVLQDAINRGATVNFVSDFPQSFENEKLDITTTYIDDAAAATGGIPVGGQYIRDTGLTAVRLT